ncbi:MAG: Crp/Fnr family transcriptional regulator [Tepidiformaceae bacterium]
MTTVIASELALPPRPVPRGKVALQRSIAWYLRQLSRLMNVLSDEEMERLIPLLTERRFRPRQVIFSAGDPAERVYLVLKGRVKIYQAAENGKEIILDVVARGGLVGDMAIVEAGERTACAQAIDDTVAVSISWEDFSHLLQQSPRLGFAMAELMAKRLAGMQRSFLNLVSKPVSARLADMLLSRQEEGLVYLGLTHQELGQTIGTSRETVTALLSRFVTMGAILPIGDGYRIADEDLLDDIANGDLQVSPRHPVAAPQPSSASS